MKLILLSRARKQAVLFLLSAGLCFAHIGSPDVFYEGKAGPYPLLVAIRPPSVIPGMAQVEIRSSSPAVREIRVVPLPMTGEAAKHPPVADVVQRSKDDPQFFTGSLWMMDFGSWQVRIDVDGAQGKARLSVPVPAIASIERGMQKQLGIALFGLMIFLFVGIVSIVGAGVREAHLEPGATPPRHLWRRSLVIMAATAIAVLGILYWGNGWWTAEANSYSSKLYKPLKMDVQVDQSRMTLQLSDPGWLGFRNLDDLVPDHNHLMHLFLIRWPEMDRMWHLHPDQINAGQFSLDLPAIPAGRYRMYADVVHANGLGETATTDAALPPIEGRPLTGDDAGIASAPVSQADFNRTTSPLSNGYRMVWIRGTEPIRSKALNRFEFHIEDAAGKPATDMEMYMGMAGHAEFVRDDGKVFAHVHPSGSIPMAALSLAQPLMHDMTHQMKMAPVVSFPYGIPEPGKYRVFVQVKRGGSVETGVFDIAVG